MPCVLMPCYTCENQASFCMPVPGYVSSRAKMFLTDIAVEEVADIWYNNDGETRDKTELS